MQLVNVQNIRCQEFDCSILLGAPLEWDEEMIQSKVDLAMASYLSKYFQAKELLAAAGSGKHPGTEKQWLLKNSDMLVQDALREYQEVLDQYTKHQEEIRKTSIQFYDELLAQGFLNLYDHSSLVSVEANWGHAHEERFQYKAQYPTGGGTIRPDFPTPFELASMVTKRERESG